MMFLVPLLSQEKQEPKDPLKDLQLVEKVQAVPDQFKAGFESITKADAEAFLKFIASDLLEGRDTNSSGYTIASEFAAALFASWGMEPAGDFELKSPQGMFGFMRGEKNDPPKRTFFQVVPLREKISEKTDLVFKETHGSAVKTYKPVEHIDYIMQSSQPTDIETTLVFAGYGLDVPAAGYNDFKGIDVKGKVVLLIEGKPENTDGGKRMAEIERVLAESRPTMRRRTLSNQVKAAQKAGALAIITVGADSSTWLAELKPTPKPSDSKPMFNRKGRSISLAMDEGMSMPWEVVPRIRMSLEMVDQMLKPYGHSIKSLKKKIDAELKPFSFSMERTRVHLVQDFEEKQVNCRNVLAFMEGADPELKKEVVVIGAHLDHLGKVDSYIYNGADDNGSGSVVVLQTAKAFMTNQVKPKRSIIFALWTGEEKGLLGSRYYVSHPFKPLKDTIAYLNIDMASRLWDKSSLGMMARMMKVENSDQLLEKIDIKKFVSFSHFESAPLSEKLKKSNEYIGLNMLLRPTQDSMGGSDHWPFGNAKIPWVFFGGAMTEDYHQPSDEVERCSFELMKAFGQICYMTAAQLAEI